MILNILTMIFIVPLFLICGYYSVLAVAGMILRGKKPAAVESGSGRGHDTTFAIIIPAHNEEDVIKVALESCRSLDYDASKYQIHVIADNCSDRTEEVAREYGALVFAREDQTKHGKGFALQWAFERILPEKHAAILILDADCCLQNNALKVFDRRIRNGAKVLQANYVVSNPDDSPISYALAVGSATENELFYWPKSRLGMAVLLRGTGMVFTREVLTSHEWAAHSIVEDVEYAMTLMKHRIGIEFVNEVAVSSEFPATLEQLKIQRTRWASGNLSIGKKESLGLIFRGMAERNFLLADAGWTMLVLYRPLVLVSMAACLVLSIVAALASPGFLSTGILLSAIALCGVLMLYFTVGIWLIGMNRRRLLLLLKTPLVTVHLIIISILGLFGVDRNLWAKTPR